MRNKLLLAAISAALLFAVGSSAQAQMRFSGYTFYNSGSPYGTPGNGSPNNVDGGR